MEQLIFLAIVGIFALGKWLLENRGSSGGFGGFGGSGETRRDDSATGRQPERQAIPPRGDSEEERMRRFMEVLGLPPGSAPPAPAGPARKEQKVEDIGSAPGKRTSPSPAPPARRFRPAKYPMGGDNPWGNVRPKKTQTTQREQEQPARPAPPVRREELRGELRQAPQLPAAPASALFEQKAPDGPPELLSVEEVAPPMELSEKEKKEPSAAGQPEAFSSLHARLRHPDALRDAFVLREILGPPKALQAP